MMKRCAPSIAVRLLAAMLLAASAVSGQVMARRAATLAAIRSYPAFYNGQPVLLRAELQQEGERASLVTGDSRIPALIKGNVSGSGVLEVRGEVWDLGRMQADDPRFSGRDIRQFVGLESGASWPKPGEIVIVNVTSASAAESLVAPSVRNLALAPERYVDQHVTVKGQFRGRNLYGDLPQAPPDGSGGRDFIIRSADAAVWVTGKQAKGRGFSFDVTSRLDTQRWIEVSGTVKWEHGLVSIVADQLAETSPQAEARAEQVEVAPALIAPEVLFSAPTADETDVPQDTKVRIQFSRDLDPATLKGRIEVAYSMTQSRERGEPEPPPVMVRVGYNPGARVMEITFDPPLERFRIVEVRLKEGIMGTDGAPLKPWLLTFTTGGS
jgi:Big-like domain-containing protein